jgi:hypothetical protein
MFWAGYPFFAAVAVSGLETGVVVALVAVTAWCIDRKSPGAGRGTRCAGAVAPEGVRHGARAHAVGVPPRPDRGRRPGARRRRRACALLRQPGAAEHAGQGLALRHAGAMGGPALVGMDAADAAERCRRVLRGRQPARVECALVRRVRGRRAAALACARHRASGGCSRADCGLARLRRTRRGVLLLVPGTALGRGRPGGRGGGSGTSRADRSSRWRPC